MYTDLCIYHLRGCPPHSCRKTPGGQLKSLEHSILGLYWEISSSIRKEKLTTNVRKSFHLTSTACQGVQIYMSLDETQASNLGLGRKWIDRWAFNDLDSPMVLLGTLTDHKQWTNRAHVYKSLWWATVSIITGFRGPQGLSRPRSVTTWLFTSPSCLRFC